MFMPAANVVDPIAHSQAYLRNSYNIPLDDNKPTSVHSFDEADRKNSAPSSI